MRFAAPAHVVVLVTVVLSCSSEAKRPAPPRRQATEEKLSTYCATDPCKSLPDARTSAMETCATPASSVTRRQGKCGAYEVLVEDSDLVTYSRYFDAAGKLVAVRAFSHEWANRTDYGTIPECVLGSLVDVCQYRAGLVAAPPSPATPPLATPPPAPTPAPSSSSAPPASVP